MISLTASISTRDEVFGTDNTKDTIDLDRSAENSAPNRTLLS